MNKKPRHFSIWKYSVVTAVMVSNLLVQLPSYSLQFPPTNGTGAPERTASGGRRDDSCTPTGGIPATALVPANNLGTTVSQTPTLFFYIPQTKAKTAELALLDNQGNELFAKRIALSSNSGIIKVDFPSTANLEINKNYRWEFAIVCDTEDRTQDRFIQGTIQRIPLSAALKAKLERADSLKKAQLYAEAKIWQESLGIAAQLHPTNPRPWEELLSSVGLEAIASQPFIE